MGHREVKRYQGMLQGGMTEQEANAIITAKKMNELYNDAFARFGKVVFVYEGNSLLLGKVKDWKAYIKPINDENLESLFKGEKVDMPDGRCYSSFSPYKKLNNHK